MHWPVPKGTRPGKLNIDELAQCLTEYYQLLARMAYMPASVIQYPPPDGWSDEDIDVQLLRKLDFSDVAIQAVRKLPYVTGQEWEVWPETWCLNYLRNTSSVPEPDWTKDYEKYGTAPPRPAEWMPKTMLALTYGFAAATPWILDTKTGLIWGYGHLLEDPDHPQDQPWKQWRHYPVKYFFDMAKADVTNLVYLPLPAGINEHPPQILDYTNKAVRRMRRIYVDHGWPDQANFRREACIEALKEFRRRETDSDLSDSTNPEKEGGDDDDDEWEDEDYEYVSEDPSGEDDDDDDDEGDEDESAKKTVESAKTAEAGNQQSITLPLRPATRSQTRSRAGGDDRDDDDLGRELSDLKNDMSPAELRQLKETLKQ
ncbi:hypothetical protein S40288_11141 [Stachybotrys chartarum IBT 40288]|nr:hypothetical protein S40288_11141 [Stachybotrys chartarum IBT 40288]